MPLLLSSFNDLQYLEDIKPQLNKINRQKEHEAKRKSRIQIEKAKQEISRKAVR